MKATEPKHSTTCMRLAASFREEAERAFEPMTQNATPRRLRQYSQRVLSGEVALRCQKTMEFLATAASLPPALAKTRLTKPLLYGALSRRVTYGHGHYAPPCETEEWSKSDPESRAIQALYIASKEADPKRGSEKLAARQREISSLESQALVAGIPGFFPAPHEIVHYMEGVIDEWASSLPKNPLLTGKCLEPSAGFGTLAGMLTEPVGLGALEVHCCEVNSDLRRILELKGLIPLESKDPRGPFDGAYDFLEVAAVYPTPQFDLVLMNPPFERDAYIDHVRAAWGVLNPGGLLLAVLPQIVFLGEQCSRKRQEFSSFVRDRAKRVMVFEDAFRSGPRPVSVPVVVVSIRKPTP